MRRRKRKRRLDSSPDDQKLPAGGSGLSGIKPSGSSEPESDDDIQLSSLDERNSLLKNALKEVLEGLELEDVSSLKCPLPYEAWPDRWKAIDWDEDAAAAGDGSFHEADAEVDTGDIEDDESGDDEDATDTQPDGFDEQTIYQDPDPDEDWNEDPRDLQFDAEQDILDSLDAQIDPGQDWDWDVDSDQDCDAE